MTSLAALLRQRRAARGEHGFALAGTLAAMLLASILVTALLGLSFASAAHSAGQLDRDEQTRAADAAIQSAIGRIARDQTGATGQKVDPGSMTAAEQALAEYCDWTPDTALGETEADRPTIDTKANGIDVEVTCQADDPEVYVPDREVGDQVLVTGEYKGAPSGSTDRLTSTAWRSTPGAGALCLPADTTCFPWREAAAAADSTSLQATPSINSLIPQLSSPSTRASVSHTGSGPLRFIGDVQARYGTEALRNERPDDCNPSVASTCTYQDAAPGVSTDGSYLQGDPGLLSGETMHPEQPAGTSRDLGDCGILESPDDSVLRPYEVPGAQVAALDGLGCDAPSAKNLNAETAQLSRPRDGAGELRWNPTDVQARLAAAPTTAAGTTLSWNGACPPSGGLQSRLIRLSPGAYTKDRTEVLSQWFGNCSNFVFHFLPGDYWFDVDRSGPAFLDGGAQSFERHSLVIDNPNNRVVFGKERGWSTYQQATAAQQPLCDSTANGVSITLSPRTSLVHRRGVVSACGDVPTSPSAQPQATIWQDPSPDLGVSVAPTQATGGASSESFTFGNWRFGAIFSWLFLGGDPVNWFDNLESGLVNPTTNQPTTSVPFKAQGDCDQLFGFIPSPWCNAKIAYAMPFAPASGTTVTDASLSSAFVTVTADSGYANGSDARTRVSIYTPDRPNSAACTNTYPRIPQSDNGSGAPTIAYDLMNPRDGNCGALLRSPGIGRQSLLNGIVVVEHEVDVEFGQDPWVQVNAARVLTGWSPVPSGSITCALPTGGRLRNYCNNAATVANPASTQWSDVRINRQRVTVPALEIFGVTIIPSWELPYWPAGDTTTSYLLSNLDDRFDPNLATEPDQTLTSAGVLVEGRSRCDVIGLGCSSDSIANRDNAGVVVSLVRPDGTNYCQSSFRRLPEFGETRYLDLLAPTGGNVENGGCAGVLNGKRNGDLLGKTLRVDFNMKPKEPCRPLSTNDAISFLTSFFTGGGSLCNWWGYDVGRIKVLTSSAPGASAVNGQFKGPRAPMRVTSNDGRTNAASKASFMMFGPLSMAGNDLDVRWSGAAPQSTLFSGYAANAGNSVTTMVVRGIGSDMVPSDPAVGSSTRVLCCASGEPGERVVELRAWVGRPDDAAFDPEFLRTVATVRILDRVPIPKDPADAPPPGEPQPGTYQLANRVIVEDWQVCTRGSDQFECRPV